MSDPIFCKPGDLLEYRCPKFGIVWQWHVHGVYLGASRQEGLIEVSPVMAQPGTKGPLPDTALMFCWLAAQNVRAVLRGYMLEKTE